VYWNKYANGCSTVCILKYVSARHINNFDANRQTQARKIPHCQFQTVKGKGETLIDWLVKFIEHRKFSRSSNDYLTCQPFKILCVCYKFKNSHVNVFRNIHTPRVVPWKYSTTTGWCLRSFIILGGCGLSINILDLDNS